MRYEVTLPVTSTVLFSDYLASALGARLGGNLTIIGASANVVVVHIAERAGYPISFGSYLKYGFIVTTQTLITATVYIYFRYLM